MGERGRGGQRVERGARGADMRGVVPIRLPPLAGVLLYVNFTYLHFLVLAIHFTLPYHTRNCYKSTELKSEGPKKWSEPTTVFQYILKLIAININAQCTLLCEPIYCLALLRKFGREQTGVQISTEGGMQCEQI